MQRQAKKHNLKKSIVRLARSVKFDANCYTVFEHNGCQYIKNHVFRQRQTHRYSSKGKGPISGNVTLVLDDEDLFFHSSQEIQPFHSMIKGL